MSSEEFLVHNKIHNFPQNINVKQNFDSLIKALSGT